MRVALVAPMVMERFMGTGNMVQGIPAHVSKKKEGI